MTVIDVHLIMIKEILLTSLSSEFGLFLKKQI